MGIFYKLIRAAKIFTIAPDPQPEGLDKDRTGPEFQKILVNNKIKLKSKSNCCVQVPLLTCEGSKNP
jgi:hypothetical protein